MVNFQNIKHLNIKILPNLAKCVLPDSYGVTVEYKLYAYTHEFDEYVI